MTSAKGIRGIEDEIDYLCNYSGLMFPETMRKNNDVRHRVVLAKIKIYIYLRRRNLRIRLINKENVNKYIQIYVLCDGTNKRFDS